MVLKLPTAMGNVFVKWDYCFYCFFNEAYCQDLVTQTSLWHRNGNQDVTKEAAMTMVCGHAFHSG